MLYNFFKKNDILNRFILFFPVFILISALLSGCATSNKLSSGRATSNKLSSALVSELFNEKGHAISETMVTVVLDEALSAQTPKLRDKDDRFVLLDINGIYSTHIINTNNKTIEDIIYSSPLYHAIPSIRHLDKDVNVKLFSLEKEFIEKHGVDCLGDKKYAEQCLSEITSRGILPVEKVREMIKTHCASQSENRTVEIFFKDETAVPLYYLAQASGLVYNWGSFWPEDQYNMFVKNSLDASTKSTISAMYGPPYVQKTVWVASDSDGNDAGTYNSLKEAQTILMNKSSGSKKTDSDNKTTQSDNSAESKSSSLNKPSEDNQNTKKENIATTSSQDRISNQNSKSVNSSNNSSKSVAGSSSDKTSAKSVALSPSSSSSVNVETAEIKKTHKVSTLLNGNLDKEYFLMTQYENDIYYYNYTEGYVGCVNMLTGSTNQFMSIGQGTTLTYNGENYYIIDIMNIKDIYFDSYQHAPMVIVVTHVGSANGISATCVVNAKTQSIVRIIQNYTKLGALGTDSRGNLLCNRGSLLSISPDGTVNTLSGPNNCFAMINAGNKLYFLEKGEVLEYNYNQFNTLFNVNSCVLGANTSNVVAYWDKAFHYYNYNGQETKKISIDAIEVTDNKSINISTNADQQIFISSNGDIVFYDKTNKALRKISSK